MKSLKKYSRYFMGALYILAGLNHFRDPNFYVQIIPDFLPNPLLLVYVSGVVEIILGILILFQRTQKLAAIGIILLLIAIFPANIYMYQQGGAKFNVSDLALLIRLPLQILLIAWAALYIKVNSTKRDDPVSYSPKP